jgi:hypothetical protein
VVCVKDWKIGRVYMPEWASKSARLSGNKMGWSRRDKKYSKLGPAGIARTSCELEENPVSRISEKWTQRSAWLANKVQKCA